MLGRENSRPSLKLLVVHILNMSDPQNTPTHCHSVTIGQSDFLLDGSPLKIRCGELHFARVPREYWRHRLRLMRAMGLNSVCAYLFWNLHEWNEGRFDWSGQADAAEFCRIAHEENLWVVLRPGPYACAEWDGGGHPWWLLKKPDINLRSLDPEYLAAAESWLNEVGRVLGPLQATRGGPIILVQAENEYGFYGEDPNYMGIIRQALLEAGFDVPLFACNPAGSLQKGYRDDLFTVVNFGTDPKSAFAQLRELQPDGPLMCGEFYSGWFDTWGAPHHRGDTDRYLIDLEYMLKEGASFSIYMAHGGTSFGMWAGADRPFKPDTSSYDYDAPISEAGWVGEKFHRTRELLARYPLSDKALPEPDPAPPAMAIPIFHLEESAPLFNNLPQSVTDTVPRHMEAYAQGRGCILYRTTVPAGPPAMLSVGRIHDFAWVYLNGHLAGVMDRRSSRFELELHARTTPARLDILVEAMGHVNFGREMHDRKGIIGAVSITGSDGEHINPKSPWEIFNLPLDSPQIEALEWRPGGTPEGPAFWRGHFEIEHPTDTFLDLHTWGKGVVWVNDRCLARFWNIGPSQTAYLPGAWLKSGRNHVIVFDLLGPQKASLAGLEKPVYAHLRPELDFVPRGPAGLLLIEEHQPIVEGEFSPGSEVQEVLFPQHITGRQICVETLSAHDGGPCASLAEIDVLDAQGESIPHTGWLVIYADSEELSEEDGSATNAINGQAASSWQTARTGEVPNHPHHLVIDLGESTEIAGIRYTPQQGNAPGRIKDYRLYVADRLVES